MLSPDLKDLLQTFHKICFDSDIYISNLAFVWKNNTEKPQKTWMKNQLV